MTEQRYRPVFAGRTPNNELIIIYKEEGHEKQLHIQRPDGELWALGPESEVQTTFDLDRAIFHISVKSSVWTGMATGTQRDLMETPAR
jgi:hypothetical protein